MTKCKEYSITLSKLFETFCIQDIKEFLYPLSTTNFSGNWDRFDNNRRTQETWYFCLLHELCCVKPHFVSEDRIFRWRIVQDFLAAIPLISVPLLFQFSSFRIIKVRANHRRTLAEITSKSHFQCMKSSAIDSKFN